MMDLLNTVKALFGVGPAPRNTYLRNHRDIIEAMGSELMVMDLAEQIREYVPEADSVCLYWGYKSTYAVDVHVDWFVSRFWDANEEYIDVESSVREALGTSIGPLPVWMVNGETLELSKAPGSKEAWVLDLEALLQDIKNAPGELFTPDPLYTPEINEEDDA